MKNKFWFLVKNTLTTKFFNKSFLFVNIAIFIALLLLTNIPNIINATVSETNHEHTVYVVNETNTDIFSNDNSKIIYESLKENDDSFNNLTLYFEILESLSSEEAYIDKIIDNEDIVIVFTEEVNGENVEILLTYYTNDPLSINVTSIVNTIYQNLYYRYVGATPPSPDNIIENIQSDQISEEKSMALRSIFPLLFGVPIFILIMMAAQFTGTEIVEEKSSKMIEIVLTNVKAGYHLLAKILAITTGIITQLILTLILGALATFIAGLISNIIETSVSSSEAPNLNDMFEYFFGDSSERLFLFFVFMIVFLIIGVLSFSVISGILASTASSVQDFNKVLTPLTMIIAAGYIINIIASTAGDNSATIMRAASFIPLVSFQIAPVAYLLGDISLIGILISILINILFVIIILRLAFNVYKEAILNFSEGSPFKILFKSFKRQKENKKS